MPEDELVAGAPALRAVGMGPYKQDALEASLARALGELRKLRILVARAGLVGGVHNLLIGDEQHLVRRLDGEPDRLPDLLLRVLPALALPAARALAHAALPSRNSRMRRVASR